MKGLVLQRGSLSSKEYVVSRSVFNRVLEPINYIVDQIDSNVDLTILDVENVDDEKLDRYDFAIFCKHNTKESVLLHQKLIENNVKVLYDFDDLIYKFTEDSIAYEHMDKVDNIKFHLEASDHVIFSNKELQEIVEEDFKIKESSVIKTGINTDKYFNSTYNPNKESIIYTNGDIIKIESFRDQFYELFNNFLKTNPALDFDVFGDTESYLKPFERYNFLGALQWDEHKYYLMKNQYLMGIVPLGGEEEDSVHRAFSICKTPIKFYEYGAMSIPCVYSKSKIYTDVVENGLTGLLVENNKDEWNLALNEMNHNEDLRKKIAMNAFQAVNEKHHVKLSSKMWYQLLK